MRTLTDDVLDVLRDADLVVGDGIGEDDTGEDLEPPYVVLYPSVQSRDGSLCSPFSDVDKQFIGRCYGASRQAAEWMADAVEAALATSPLTVTELTRSEAQREDDTAELPLWFTAVRARIRSYA